MNRAIWEIEMRSVKTALEHLGMIDLGELAAACRVHGDAADRALIDAVRRCLASLPTGHP